MAEYELLIKAEKLKQVDLDYRCHLVAYLVKAASAEKPNGKNKTAPVYKNFRKFFDYKKAVRFALDGKDEAAERLQRLKAYRNKEE